MKKLTELNKNEKVMLLKSIAAGEVDRAKLTPDTLVALEKSDAFLSLQIAASPGNESMNIIHLGAAKQAMDSIIEIEIQNEDGEIMTTVRTIP